MPRHTCLSTSFTLILNALVILTAFPISPVNGAANKEPCELLIIGLERYRTTIQRFIDFKQSQGTASRYMSIEYIDASLQGPNIAWRLHEFVASEYRRSGTKYLLLIGTYEQVPTKYVYSPSHEIEPADFNYKPTDWYYAVPDWRDSQTGLLGGNIPKIAVGRLPIRNEEELDQTLSKIIEAETHPSQGLFLIFSGLSVTIEPILSFPYTYYPFKANSTSKTLSQILSSEVAYAITYTHGSPTALWIGTTDGKWKTLMTNEDVNSMVATYDIHYLVACFAGALDLEKESLARALITSSKGPALVIASSRTEAYDNNIVSGFWENFFNTGDVGGSTLEALESYLSDRTVFSPQDPMFQKYNLYLNKVIYGDVSWRVKDPRKNVVFNSALANQSEPSVFNGNEAQTISENSTKLTDLTAVVPLFTVFLCSAFVGKIYRLHTKKRINRKSQAKVAGATN